MKRNLFQMVTALWQHIRTLLQLAYAAIQQWQLTRHWHKCCEEIGEGLASRGTGEPTILEQLAALDERMKI